MRWAEGSRSTLIVHACNSLLAAHATKNGAHCSEHDGHLCVAAQVRQGRADEDDHCSSKKDEAARGGVGGGVHVGAGRGSEPDGRRQCNCGHYALAGELAADVWRSHMYSHTGLRGMAARTHNCERSPQRTHFSRRHTSVRWGTASQGSRYHRRRCRSPAGDRHPASWMLCPRWRASRCPSSSATSTAWRAPVPRFHAT